MTYCFNDFNEVLTTTGEPTRIGEWVEIETEIETDNHVRHFLHLRRQGGSNCKVHSGSSDPALLDGAGSSIGTRCYSFSACSVPNGPCWTSVPRTQATFVSLWLVTGGLRTTAHFDYPPPSVHRVAHCNDVGTERLALPPMQLSQLVVQAYMQAVRSLKARRRSPCKILPALRKESQPTKSPSRSPCQTITEAAFDTSAWQAVQKASSAYFDSCSAHFDSCSAHTSSAYFDSCSAHTDARRIEPLYWPSRRSEDRAFHSSDASASRTCYPGGSIVRLMSDHATVSSLANPCIAVTASLATSGSSTGGDETRDAVALRSLQGLGSQTVQEDAPLGVCLLRAIQREPPRRSACDM